MATLITAPVNAHLCRQFYISKRAKSETTYTVYRTRGSDTHAQWSAARDKASTWRPTILHISSITFEQMSANSVNVSFFDGIMRLSITLYIKSGQTYFSKYV